MLAPLLAPTTLALALLANDDWPPTKSPAEAGVDAKALESLLEKARLAKSDAVIVLVDGAMVSEEYFDRTQEPIELMSCTKSVVSLLVGILVDEKKIASLETPVSKFFPDRKDWKSGAKKDVTVGHLLSHTSGLKCNPTTEEIYASKDFVKLALDAEVVDAPGTKFFYNNKAVNLLAGVIEKASGKKMDDFARERLFEPLGITEFGWTKDASGNPHGMSGLQLHALDFAKLGQLVLQRGEWDGERIVSEAWLAASTKPAHPEIGPDAARCGLLWWLESSSGDYSWDAALIEKWKKAGGSKRLLAVGELLRGKHCKSLEETRAALRAAIAKASREAGADGAAGGGWFDPEVNRLGVPFWNETPGPIAAFGADGYLGNYLVVVPERKLVAVRQRRYPNDEAETQNAKYSLSDFSALARALLPPPR